MTIYEDPEVASIFDFSEGAPRIDLRQLEPAAVDLVMAFVSADQIVQQGSPREHVISALAAGVRAVEGLANAPIGWTKFIAYQTGCNVQILAASYPTSIEVRIFGDWVSECLARNGWKPDGFTSAIGSLASNVLAVSAAAGGGVHLDEASGRFLPPSGDLARQVLGLSAS